MADASVAFSGWNSSNTTWNSGTWGGDAAVPGATGALSAVTVVLNDSVTLTGIAASALLNGDLDRDCCNALVKERHRLWLLM